MFNINDCVFYSGTGVCRITGIQVVKLGGTEEQECYVLKPFADLKSNIYTPITSSESLNDMSPILTKEDIYNLIQDMPKEESIWINNERERSRDYFAKIRSCDSRQLIRLIKTLYLEKNINSKGKRLNTTDSKIMGTAEKLLYEEFAFVLGIDLKEVIPIILERIPQNAQAS